jgi:DNA polymerase-3 subunit beta
MKIVIKKEPLLEKLNLASRFTSTRLTNIAALQGIYFVGEKNKLHIYSTNLSSYYHGQIKIENEKEFKAIIEQKKIIELLQLLQPGEVEIEIEENKIIFKQGKTKGSFPLIKQEDYPLPPVINKKPQIIKKGFFEKNLPLVLFAAAKDETRPALSGVKFFSDGELFYLVSTDGFRLSLVKTRNTENLPPVLLPASFLEEVLREMKGQENISFIYLEEEKICVFILGEDEYYSRSIEGEFPPFEKVIPAEKRTIIKTNSEELMRKIKIVSVFAREFSNIVVCEFKKGDMILRPKTESGGESGSSQEVEVEGEEQTVAFNFKFLLDFLSRANNKKIEIEVLRPDAPVVFRYAEENEFLHIIMPVRIQEQ